jgi:hypothetical protein
MYSWFIRAAGCALAFAASAAAAAPPAAAAASASSLEIALARAAPSANPAILALATQALACARTRGLAQDPRTLSVIDYSQASTQQRLWVFDLERRALLFREWVAHGRNSGDNYATHFSNGSGSLMTSLGAYVTEDTYQGHNGYSLRLRGLDAGFNDNADSRAIVIHGARYVSADLIRSQGRLGRSFGCPAVRPDIAQRLIDAIRGGSFVFAYYPDRDWLQRSQLLSGDCGGAAPVLAANGAAGHS